MPKFMEVSILKIYAKHKNHFSFEKCASNNANAQRISGHVRGRVK